MGYLIVCLYALWTLADVCADENPGVKVRLTKYGLHYANKLAQIIMNEEIKNIKFPRIEVSVDEGPGKGRIEISKVKFTNFESPEYNYQLMPPNGIAWSSRNGRITLQADWAAWYKIIMKFTLDGRISATVDNIQISADTEVVKGRDGRPEVRVPNCKAKVGHVKVNITGGQIPSVMNLFWGPIADGIQNAIEKKLCDKTQNVLIHRINQRLRVLPAKWKVWKEYMFDYTLTSDPMVTPDFVDVAIKGAISHQGQPSLVEAPKMPQTNDKVRMVYVAISDFVANSFFDSAQQNGFLKRTINRDLYPDFTQKLQTSCSKETKCVGSMLKDGKIGELYPDTYVSVDVWSSKSPKVIFKSATKTAEISGQAEIKLYAEPVVENTTLLLHLKVEVQIDVQLRVNRSRLFCDANVKSLDLEIAKSNIGEFGFLESYTIGDLARDKLQEAINARVSEGFPIPPLKHVELLEPNIRIVDRAIQMETDLKYKGI